MRITKRRREYISFYNHTGLEKHFTKMAQKGWLIEKISNYNWIYQKIEPKDIHFCVTYYPRASDFDPEPSEQEQTFHDFCAHTGWQLACTWHQMQVFYNEEESPIPLETDPVLEVETLHKACKKNYLPSNFFLLALSLIMGGLSVGWIFVDPIGLLSNSSSLMSSFAFVLLAIISIVELGAYFTWHSKAKKAALDGIWVDTPSTTNIQKAVMVLLVVALILWLTNLFLADDPILLWVSILMFAYMMALTAVVNCVKEGLKKEKASRGTNKTLTLLTSFILTFVMVGSVIYLTIFVSQAGLLEKDTNGRSDIPLSIQDLTGQETDGYIEEHRRNRTVLVGQTFVHQFPHWVNENSLEKPDLKYTVTSVGLPLLYDWCKDQMYSDKDESDDSAIPTGHKLIYVEQDAAPWGANEVYRLYQEEGWYTNQYLLCYEDRIIEIRFDWEPTEEQMAIVGRKLNP